MKTIEEINISVGLYNKLKRKGINTVQDISKYDFNKLTKSELIELVVEIYGDFK